MTHFFSKKSKLEQVAIIAGLLLGGIAISIIVATFIMIGYGVLEHFYIPENYIP